MEQRFSLGAGGAVTVREEGNRVVFEADMVDDGLGLYKAYFRSGGGRTLLGTMMPERGRLSLRRSWTLEELQRKKIWPPQGAEVELAYSFQQKEHATAPQEWTKEENPGRYLGERILRDAAVGMRAVIMRREEDGFALAVPWTSEHPFPLTPIFCFARIEEINGARYAVFHFSGCGCPVFPGRTGGPSGATSEGCAGKNR